ncbi:hypothetical protein DL990_27495 [Amycolatopsis sp. WAC 01416]|uniref:hypothetical protein n=1 Tax=Amycolatopsis sp. WAC 01416 TaxID=2203196 RepID=UPI000F78BEBA|nr:hypothetical protein [Amycolatopsis sp. WAC 01416]RSN28416.1 hypothetical protein DL990_27495 [Amycolatopsis sp. WAC 01416]
MCWRSLSTWRCRCSVKALAVRAGIGAISPDEAERAIGKLATAGPGAAALLVLADRVGWALGAIVTGVMVVVSVANDSTSSVRRAGSSSRRYLSPWCR